MKLYELTNKEYCLAFSIKDFKQMDEFKDVEKLAGIWTEQKLKVISKGKEGDLFFSFNPMNHLIISEQAYGNLKSCLSFEDVEFLQVKYGKKIYYIIHGIKAYDLKCELVERGKFFYDVFDVTDMIDKKMDQKYMFRVQFEHGVISGMFYTEKFMELVKELDLQGVDFEVAWDSEAEI